MFATLVSVLPVSWQPKAKAIWAGGGSALAAFLLVGLLLGTWDNAALIAILVGVPTGVGTHEIPNRKNGMARESEVGYGVVGLIVLVLLAALVYLLLAALTGSAILAVVGAVLVLVGGLGGAGWR